MTLATKLILIAALVLSIIIPFGYYLIGEKNKERYKRAIGSMYFSSLVRLPCAGIMLFGSVPVQAADSRMPGALSQPDWDILQQHL